jgi:diphthamide synthase (EF-2-diphthine--ammonia ligase)
MRRLMVGLMAVAFTTASAQSALAGPASDALGKCLAASSTRKDRADLLRWMFAAMSANADVQTLATTTPEQRDAASRQAAEVVQRLMLADCRPQAVAALKENGPAAVGDGFKALGARALNELADDPGVKSVVSGAVKYIDVIQFIELMKEAGSDRRDHPGPP